MKISKVSSDQAIKIGKAAAYVGVSAIISYFIGIVTEQPELFGIYTPIVNIVLVTLKQLFTDPQ